MSAVKEEALKIIENLSEDEGWEDIMYRIYVRESIEHGLEDLKNNKILTDQEAKTRLSKWLN